MFDDEDDDDDDDDDDKQQHTEIPDFRQGESCPNPECRSGV